jgi:hypothetical protein
MKTDDRRPVILQRGSFCTNQLPDSTGGLIGERRRMGRMLARTRQYRNIEPSAIPFLRRINGHGKSQLPWRGVFAGDIGR